MAISMEQVKELRAQTGAGVVDAKKALTEANGDLKGAIKWLREKGKATAAKKADRATHEGTIGVYVHSNGKIVSLVSVLCETDFVAKSDRFQTLAKDIAMHVAAMSPSVVNPSDVPEDEIAVERELAQKQAEAAGKPPQIAEKMIEGKLRKFREERALLTQPFVKEADKTIEQLVQAAIQEIGENITIKDFVRLSI
ncbi:MAG: translation elongation factor Ts [Candidatus Andersenbacteria bacterium]|nr:translation elongation factor Ts [Candidatus Andersenbacteria bacterium]MBI3250503.1 translation elongation factor Ts [Candidatus Andersenbacteria bacterium]